MAATHRRRRTSAAFDPEGRASASPTPEEHAETQQAFELLLELTADLDPSIREAFILSDVLGLSAPEIAELVDAKESTIYSRVRLGRRHFDRALARHRACEKGARHG